MTSEKYLAVLQSEKCMNDAILSVLANLHAAARKKRDTAWSPYTYDSLANIWDDHVDPETNPLTSAAEDNAEANLSVKGNDLNIQGDALKGQENCLDEDGEELSFQAVKSGVGIVRKCPTSGTSLNGQTYPLSRNNLKNISDFSSDPNSCQLVNEWQNLPEFQSSTFRRPVQYGAPDKLSFSNQNSLTNGVGSRGHEDSLTRPVENQCVHPLPRSVLTTTFHLCKEGANSDDDEILRRPSTSKTKRKQKLSKQSQEHLVKQNTMRSKRNRDDSDSSAGSVEKKKPEAVHRNGQGDIFKALLSVRISKEDQFHEIAILASEFERVRRKYPKLKQVLPDVDAAETEVPYCVEAVKVIIGHLFHPPCDFDAIPDGRVSVEVLAASRAWSIQRFHDNFQQYFAGKITEGNCRTVYSLARHFGLLPICSACQAILIGETSGGGGGGQRLRSCKPRKCYVAVSRYTEPVELRIPLGRAEQRLNDNFDRDIRNTIVFGAVARDFRVAGFQISLDVDETPSAGHRLDIFYSTKLEDGSAEEMKLSRPLRPTIAVYFQKRAEVRKGEKMQVSVETTIKPYLCFETRQSFVQTSDAFSLTVESTYRVKSSGGKRFIIGKLLYNTQ